jgi:ABC-type antimicrobial peptide transport system permease subunit
MQLIGGAIGLAAAMGLGRLARSMLFELEGYDPTAVVSAVVLLACVAIAAGFVPAVRAARVDPMSALRYD